MLTDPWPKGISSNKMLILSLDHMVRCLYMIVCNAITIGTRCWDFSWKNCLFASIRIRYGQWLCGTMSIREYQCCMLFTTRADAFLHLSKCGCSRLTSPGVHRVFQQIYRIKIWSMDQKTPWRQGGELERLFWKEAKQESPFKWSSTNVK